MSELAQRNQDDRTPAQKLIAGLRSEAFRTQLEAALPPTVTPERFVRIAVTALQQNPSIADAEPDSILQALMQCAQDGLLPDGKEAAIVNRKNTKKGTVEASYMPMIGGFRKIAADHGWTIRTEVVYANDEFEHTEEPPAILHHPVRPGVERGALVAAYAVARHKDGRREQKVMYADEIMKRRAMASNSAVWDKWPGPMAAKTLGRDIFKELPIGELDERFYRILEATTPEVTRAAALYGPPRAQVSQPPVFGELPPAAEDDGGQQADASMGDASAPGPTDDDGGDGEPDLEPPAAAEGSQFVPPVDPAEDPAVAAAMQAAMFEIPNGKHKGVSLGEVLGKPGGETWLGWALTHIENPPIYKQAIHDFARVYSPEQYQQALGQAELAS